MVDISVIVPALNEEKYLGKCLESIRSQKTELSYELIVVDSNSTDNTVRIAKKYADKVLTCEGKGIWRARNLGAKKSKSNVLCFFDADTILPKNYFSSVYPIISEDDSIAALSCAFRFDERSSALEMIETICNNYLLLKGLAGKGEILGFNNVINKKYFQKVGGFPNKPLEDGALSIKMRKVGRVVYLSEPRVITSSRRLSESGIIYSTLYYAGMSVATNVPNNLLKNLFKYKRVD